MSHSPSPQDAIRVVTAAVLAQQSALAEHELRLRERESTLAEQEAQVAARLDARRRQLGELQEQLSVGREQFRSERAAAEALRAEVAQIYVEARAERERLQELRPKFIRRLKRQWAAQRNRLAERSAELDRLRRSLDDESARQLRERLALEKNRREVEHERDCVKEIEARVKSEADRLAREQQAAEHDIAQREARLSEERQHFEAERADAERRLESLHAEAQLLEQRVAASRGVQTASDDGHPQDDALRQRATALIDQRYHLTDLLHRLAGSGMEWHESQLDAVAEMERIGRELLDEDDRLHQRASELERLADRLRQERDLVGRLRTDLEKQAADLALRQSDWLVHRNELRAELDERQRFLEAREEALPKLFAAWRRRRQAEVDQLRQIVQTTVAQRRAWADERDRYLRRADAIRRTQQALAEQALALEQARQEFLGEAHRPEAAARRLERLRRRWEGLSAASRREGERLRQRLADEDAELHRIYIELEGERADLARRQRDLNQQQTELEAEKDAVRTRRDEFNAARLAWNEQRRQYDLLIIDLRAEVDRLARLLPDNSEVQPLRSAA